MDAVLGHGFHPLKARQRRSIPNLQTVHRHGRIPRLGAKTAKIAKRESGKSVLDEDNWRSERKMKVVAFGNLAIKRFGHSLRRRGPQLIAFNSKPPRHEGGHICDQYA
jgi:hypothetical protein